MNALTALTPFARPPEAPGQSPAIGPSCQLCAAPIDEAAHGHLVDLDAGALLCGCGGCARLFAQPGSGPAHYRTVPTRVLVDPDLVISDEQWAALRIPVRLAFVFKSSRLGRWVALYPSPAGATEADVAPEPVDALVARSPMLAAMQPDVEALLAYGRRGERLTSYVAPIDVCYELVGLVRRDWQGFHGGDRAWDGIEALFARLDARAERLP